MKKLRMNLGFLFASKKDIGVLINKVIRKRFGGFIPKKIGNCFGINYFI